MRKQPIFYRCLSALVALVIMVSSIFSSAPIVKAASGYDVPQVGDVAWLVTGNRLMRSDATTTGTAYPYYSMWDSGGGDLRNFRFNTESWTGNKNYDPDTQLYCVQHGKTISTSQYVAAAPATDAWWNGLSEIARIGILLSIGFGAPATSASELNSLGATLGYDQWASITRDDVAAATQILVWEFEQGYRTSFTGKPTNPQLYNAYIEGEYNGVRIWTTPAYDAYWAILHRANKYYSDSRFNYENLKVDSNFMLWVQSGSQSIISYTLPKLGDGRPNTPFYNTGSIEVYKKDPSGRPLSGATFLAVNTNDPTLVYSIGPTNSDGYASRDEILYGTYTITETVFPSGYTSSGETSWTRTLNDDTTKITINAVNQLATGDLKIIKTTNTGANLANWEFTVKNSSGSVVGTYKTGSDGTVTVTGLNAGSYTVQEVASSDSYWSSDTNVRTITINPGQTTDVSFNNTHYGRIQIIKTTNTGSNLGNWEFVVRNSSGTVVGTYTTAADGTVTTGNLLPGTYTVTETARNDSYWSSDTEAKTVTVIAGNTSNVSVRNTHYGRIKITKTTNTGANLSDWEFVVRNSSGSVVGTYRTGADGTVTTDNLLPGTYTVTETARNDNYWSSDTSAKTVTVSGGNTSDVSVRNTHYGRIQIIKTTNTGASLANWEFTVRDSSGSVVGTYRTGADGTVTTGNLLPGNYTVTETASGDSYWSSDTEAKTVSVTAGNTASVSVRNTHYGRIQITKTTNTGVNLGNWEFTVRNSSGTIVGTYRTGVGGTVTTGNLLPGTYTVTETASGDSFWSSDTSARTVTVTAGETANVSINNIHYGRIKITKTTNTGANLSDWEFVVRNSSGTYVGTYKTGADGTVITDNLLPGIYTVTETARNDSYWSSDTSAKMVTVVAGQVAELSVNNTHYGRIQIIKTTNTGANLGDWEFTVRNSSGTIVGTYRTGADGTVTTDNLLPGTYTVTETARNDSFWSSDTEAKTVTVAAGETANVSVRNTHYGRIQITKTTNTGANLGDWEFTVRDSSGTVVGTYTTSADGTVTTANLLPGTYTVTETARNDNYWSSDTEAKTVTVTAGDTANVSIRNTHYGRIQIIKTTNTGANLGDWEFTVRDSSGTVVGTYTTAADGTVTTINLLPGTYTVTETARNDSYWNSDTEAKTVTVTAGETADVSIRNTHYGKVNVTKTTNTGVNLNGWKFDIFSDAECTNKVDSIVSDNDGKAEAYLVPGTYWIKEVGDTEGRWNSQYWTCDTEPQRIEITAGRDTDVTFTNTHYGKIQIHKKMDTDGPVSGWKFQVTRLSDNADMGILITDENGTIISGKLLPGEYRIEELFETNSLYYCKDANPVTITVTEDETAEVTFTNALRPGKITIEKVNFSGQHLADAKFLLEWSEDGTTWTPVTFSDKEDVVKGGCTSADLTDGCLVTDDTGIIVFEGLYPSLQYRVTEVEAPEGYVLLADYAFVGELPVEDLTVDLVVHNGQSYIIPAVGVTDTGIYIIIGCTLAALALAGIALGFFDRLKAVFAGRNTENK